MVKFIETVEEFEGELKAASETNTLVVIDFTASW
jgi:hypothetical protein